MACCASVVVQCAGCLVTEPRNQRRPLLLLCCSCSLPCSPHNILLRVTALRMSWAQRQSSSSRWRQKHRQHTQRPQMRQHRQQPTPPRIHSPPLLWIPRTQSTTTMMSHRNVRPRRAHTRRWLFPLAAPGTSVLLSVFLSLSLFVRRQNLFRSRIGRVDWPAVSPLPLPRELVGPSQLFAAMETTGARPASLRRVSLRVSHVARGLASIHGIRRRGIHMLHGDGRWHALPAAQPSASSTDARRVRSCCSRRGPDCDVASVACVA